MTEELRKKMIDKVRKLLALATSANENEAALAAEKAQAILAEYNLDLSEVKSIDHDEDEDVEIMVGGVTSKRPWRRPLAQAVAQMYFCTYFYQGIGKKEQHSFVGSKANTQVATMMFQYLSDTIHRLGNKEALKYPKSEHSRARVAFKGAAALRVCVRIRERIAAAKAGQAKASDGRNLPALLSLYDQWKSKNDAHVAAHIGKLRERRSLVRGNHFAASIAGREAGDRIGLDLQVGGHSSKQIGKH